MYKPVIEKTACGKNLFFCRNCPRFKTGWCNTSGDCVDALTDLLAEAEEEIEKLNIALTTALMGLTSEK